jgi:hypothetical protein
MIKQKEDKKLVNPIDEYFLKVENSKEHIHAKAIFETTDDGVDLKTDLSAQEIVLINKLKMNDDFLIDRGLKGVFGGFVLKYLRLKISLERKSRGEFVNINKSNNTDEVLNGMSNLSNITGAKK